MKFELSQARFGLWMIGLAFAIVPNLAHSRVFDYKSEHFASYLGGTYGPSAVGRSAFEDSSGVKNTFDKKVESNLGASFGFVLAAEKYTLKVGAEFLFARTLSGIEATNAAGTKVYNLDSSFSCLIPEARGEFNYLHFATFKAYVGGGIGMAYANLENKYTFTSAGTTAYGIADFSEVASSTVPTYKAYTGAEILFTDTVTIGFEVGYRYLLVNNLTFDKDATTFLGTVSKGDAVKTRDGDVRRMNMSGLFTGVSLQFYF